MLKTSALTGAILTWCGLFGCSDPVPPSASGALSTTIAQTPTGTCTNTRGPISIGESSTTLLGGYPGTNRIVNGENGAISCTVQSTGTGYKIKADFDADAQEGNPLYHQKFSIDSDYPLQTPHAPGALARVTSTDTRTQTNRFDNMCTIDVIRFGDGGGAVFATFKCDNFIDDNTPGTGCVMTGTIVLENCVK